MQFCAVATILIEEHESRLAGGGDAETDARAAVVGIVEREANAGSIGRESCQFRLTVHGDELTIHLRSPAPDFVQRLALPYFCAVPVSAPDKQSDTLPSAGPYAIASYRVGRSLAASSPVRTPRT